MSVALKVTVNDLSPTVKSGLQTMVYLSPVLVDVQNAGKPVTVKLAIPVLSGSVAVAVKVIVPPSLTVWAPGGAIAMRGGRPFDTLMRKVACAPSGGKPLSRVVNRMLWVIPASACVGVQQ